jgi:hypothetical protein
MTITNSQISQARKILDVYLVGYFAESFTPANDLLDAAAEMLLQDIQYWNEPSNQISDFLKSGKVGAWQDTVDEIMNEIFLDNPENNEYMEW